MQGSQTFLRHKLAEKFHPTQRT